MIALPSSITTPIAAFLAGAALASGAAWWALGDYYATRDDLRAAEADLRQERIENARLTLLVGLERDRATAADFARAEEQRVNRETGARMDAMEELIDEIRATPGADDPAPPVIADALERVLRAGSGAGGGNP